MDVEIVKDYDRSSGRKKAGEPAARISVNQCNLLAR